MTEHILDAQRLLCPMPVIKAQNLSKQLAHGDRLKILATDPGAQHDLPSWARINGHKLLSCATIEGIIEVEVELVKEEK